jgi:hypothetical protein
MKLETYLAQNQLSPEEFGRRVGKSGTIVRAWIRGAVPSGKSCWEIEKETNRQVGFKDFFEDGGANDGT